MLLEVSTILTSWQHAPGTLASVTNPTTASNGFGVIVDQNRKIDQWNVDDLRLDGRTLSSQTTDAHVVIDPNGSGEVHIPDDTKLGVWWWSRWFICC